MHPNSPAQHTLNSLDAAARCVRWLLAKQFTVNRVTLGARNPRIDIAASPRCATLEGAVYSRTHTCRVWVARQHDCEIRWQEATGAR